MFETSPRIASSEADWSSLNVRSIRAARRIVAPISSPVLMLADEVHVLGLAIGWTCVAASRESLSAREPSCDTREMSDSPSQATLASKCPNCNVEMTDLGDIPFRVGGSGAAAHLLFGNWAEMGESLLHLDAFMCQSCGRVEFFADSQTRDSLR